MSHPLVSALYVHPLKSAAAVSVGDIELDARGATGDRRWMLIDNEGVAVTAREQHRLTLVRPSFATIDRNGPLVLDAHGLTPIHVSVPDGAECLDARIWDDVVPVFDAGDAAAAWCSDALGARCRLVYLAPNASRPLAERFAGSLPFSAREVALSDGAPLLLLGMSSVNALNARLLEQGGEAMDVLRFRPNVLLSGTAAHEEDTWREIAIGEVTVGVGSRCPRCVMTTIDPATADAGVEPLRTLSRYRREENGVVFGVNATHAGPGVVRVGDTVIVRALR